MGIASNERADELVKAGCLVGGPSNITEGGVRALWKRLGAGERSVVGYHDGAGRVLKWGRRMESKYVLVHTGKGDHEGWSVQMGRGCGLCRLCQQWAIETGYPSFGMRGDEGESGLAMCLVD